MHPSLYFAHACSNRCGRREAATTKRFTLKPGVRIRLRANSAAPVTCTTAALNSCSASSSSAPKLSADEEEAACASAVSYLFPSTPSSSDVETTAPAITAASNVTLATEPPEVEPPQAEAVPPGTIAGAVVVVAGVTTLYILMLVQSVIPWKAPVAKYILGKLGLLWCFNIDYPTEKDPEAQSIEMLSVCYRKSNEKCGCTASVLGGCTIPGPTATPPATSGDPVEPSTSLFDPMTKLYRCLGLPGTESGCGKWCAVHGPDPDASNSNILFAPGAAILQNCCIPKCWPETDKADFSSASQQQTTETTAFGFTSAAGGHGTGDYLEIASQPEVFDRFG